ncbi:hypothetical protein VTI74DRAFT_2482 [Chaetomium olivicolor]
MVVESKVLLYLVRRDLRVADQPVLHSLATERDHGFTHLVPVYVFSAQQINLSGLVKDGSTNPFPEPKSLLLGYPRCGPHRAKFLAEAVWDLKRSLERLESGLVVRAGIVSDVLRGLAQGLAKNSQQVVAIWMTSHEGPEEKNEEKAVASLCRELGAEFRLWEDEKYFINDRDAKASNLDGLPNIFTDYRKSQEPLRLKPKAPLPAPEKGTLPPFPESSMIPEQDPPFVIPDNADDLVEALVRPVQNTLSNMPKFPDGVKSAHPFIGGETPAHTRLKHLVQSGHAQTYHQTRNGLLGTDFSTKLSAFLAQGCITARQVHDVLVGYEDGTCVLFKDVDGYGQGENEGTRSIRQELLWRDYMRLCHKKFKDALFRLEGFHKTASGSSYGDDSKQQKTWKSAIRSQALSDQDPKPDRIAEVVARFNLGATGMGFIDASQRELLHTGYTSNRARQNVASFLAKHLDIDWRYGAEWYEAMLVDYDVSSNWGNWAYMAGVGNDPRGEQRLLNPVKQGFTYDPDGRYVRSWVPELRKLQKLENVFQAWTASEEDIREAGLEGNVMVTDPVKKISFSLGPPKPKRRDTFRSGARRGSGSGRGGRHEGAAGKQGGPQAGNRRHHQNNTASNRADSSFPQLADGISVDVPNNGLPSYPPPPASAPSRQNKTPSFLYTAAGNATIAMNTGSAARNRPGVASRNRAGQAN